MDVLDHDAALKLKQWFEDRWSDRFCVEAIQPTQQPETGPGATRSTNFASSSPPTC